MLPVPSTLSSKSLRSNDQLPASSKNSSSPSTPPKNRPMFFLRKNKTRKKNTPPQQLKSIKILEDHNSPKKNSPDYDIIVSSPDNPNAARSKKALVLGRVAKARFTR